jgi:hypothetical protein
VSADNYLLQVLAQYDVSRNGLFEPAYKVLRPLGNELVRAFSSSLSRVQLSGSNAKGTAVRGGTDVDLFLSFAPSSTTLRDIYQDVYDYALRVGYAPRKQNVSIGITYSGHAVDLVPGRQQQTAGYHSLYRRRANTWTQTNVDLHIQRVLNSGHTDEIQVLKIWRNLHQVDFPSFFLELLALEAFENVRTYGFAASVFASFRYIADNISHVRILDPANSNNVVSDDLTAAEKQRVAVAASRAATRSTWEDIVW